MAEKNLIETLENEMSDDGGTIIFFVFLFVMLMALVSFGSFKSGTDSAIANCIQGHNDWSVQQANTYCNLLIREGKVP